MKVSKNSKSKELTFTDDADDSLVFTETDGGLIASIDTSTATWVILDRLAVIDLAAALAHFVETGRLPEPGEGGDLAERVENNANAVSEILGKAKSWLERHDRRINHLDDWADTLTNASDQHEKNIKVIASDMAFYERRITRLESHVKALIKDLEANDA